MNMGDERHNHDVTIGLAFINVDISTTVCNIYVQVQILYCMSRFRYYLMLCGDWSTLLTSFIIGLRLIT